MKKIERAILMAAGKGERLQPVTLDTPKPLVNINGKAMIETIIEALEQNGIKEIYVVIGYKKEMFSYLPQKYESVTLIENNIYDKCNNISSLYAAREHLKNTFITDGDIIISNPDVFNPLPYESGYCIIKTNEPTNEWTFDVDDNNYITNCDKSGGHPGNIQFGISRWTEEDSEKLRKYLEYEFEANKNTDLFWDDVALQLHLDDFKLKVYEISNTDVTEIDSFAELVAADSSYGDYK